MIARLAPVNQFPAYSCTTGWSGCMKSGKSIDGVLPHGASIGKTGLILPEELALEQWEGIGIYLVTLEVGIQWAIGDWWCYGHHTYGQRKALAAVKTIRHKFGDYKFGSLMNLGSVARSVQPSLRNEVLSWSHHKEVAKLEPDDQKKWLARAVKRKWSSAKLRDKIHDEASTQMQRDPEHPDHAYLANIWADGFIAEAKRPNGLAFYRWDDAKLDLVGMRRLASLVDAASSAATFWSETAIQLTQYQRKRLSAGSAFKPRTPDMVDERHAQLDAGLSSRRKPPTARLDREERRIVREYL